MKKEIKILSLSIILLLNTIASLAQTSNETEKIPQPAEWALNINTYLIAFLVIILLITILVLYNITIKLIKAIAPKAFEKAKTPLTEAGIHQEEAQPGFLRKVYLRLVDSVPVAKEKDILLDHDYDGIKELDNNLPPWWKWGFYVTIFFAVFYLIGYHVTGTGKLQEQEYADELALAAKQKEERMKNAAENITEDNVVLLSDAEAIGKGKEIYEKYCAACHLADGGGQVGPNLTDEYWLHGGGIKNVFKTITYGVPAKGMISWQSQLSPRQIQQVASFVLSLKGTTPAAPKEPQGEKWLEQTVADSLPVAGNDTTAMVVK